MILKLQMSWFSHNFVPIVPPVGTYGACAGGDFNKYYVISLSTRQPIYFMDIQMIRYMHV